MSAAAGVGAALTGAVLANCSRSMDAPPVPFAVDPIDPVRVGYVGVGLQGSSHVRNLLGVEGVQIKAVCDIVEEKVRRIQDRVEAAGQPRPEGYSNGETDFLRLCERDDIDLVYTATPWEWHVPVCVAAMKNGKHAATEVPAAVTLDECWQLVETSEQTKRYCVMMENCCYGDLELLTLNLVRKGLLGELLHAEVGYLHDLRRVKFEDANEGLWRRAHSIRRNGNLYPTHGLGPAAQCFNINRGDRFDYLVSMSGNSRGLYLWAEEHYAPDHPKRKEKYALGDINVTLICTANGLTITLYHDTNLPRPYSRGNLIQGTKGLIQGYPERIHIEGTSPAHEWETLDKYYEQYEHPLAKNLRERSAGAGHGGMDYIEDYRLIQALRTGTTPDTDVYDAADWSIVSELSERSVAQKCRRMDFPDFTRGAWKTRKPLGVVEG